MSTEPTRNATQLGELPALAALQLDAQVYRPQLRERLPSHGRNAIVQKLAKVLLVCDLQQ
jgi:hypothetical protein